MRKLFKNVFVLLVISKAFYCLAQQPQWNWGIRAGAGSNGSNPFPIESVWDMVTDDNGNVYYLGVLKAEQASLTGVTGMIQLYDWDDIVLASYDCHGNYRWHKIIGTSSSDGSEFNNGLGIDALGGIYVTSVVSPNYVVKFGNDYTLPATNIKRTFLMKYGTSGVFQWIIMPEPNDMGGFVSGGNTAFCDIYVEPDGDIYALAATRGGYLMGSTNFTQPGNYILHYNKDGTFLNSVKLDYEISLDPDGPTYCKFRLVRDSNNGNFYVSGTTEDWGTELIVNGNPLGGGSALLMAFNSQGTYLWHKTNTQTAAQLYGRPQLDSLGNITVSGVLFGQDSFAGYVRPANALHQSPFIIQLSPTGNTNWSIGSRAQLALIVPMPIVKKGNEIIAAGMMYGTFNWEGQPVVNYNGISVELFRFNLTTGAYLGVLSSFEVISGFGESNFITAITTDKNNNILLGGSFSTALNVTGTTMYSNGGLSDLFVARFGSDCTLEVEKFSKPLELKLYPNPTYGLLTLENVSKGDFIEIYDVLGRSVLKVDVNQTAEVLDVSMLLPGSYYLVLNGLKMIKFIRK